MRTPTRLITAALSLSALALSWTGGAQAAEPVLTKARVRAIVAPLYDETAPLADFQTLPDCGPSVAALHLGPRARLFTRMRDRFPPPACAG
jgi:hypothetical protein